MNSECKDINLAIEICKLHNCSIKEISTGWTEVSKIFYMEQSLTSELRDEIKNKANIDYWKSDKDKHYPKEEGFICVKCKESISFPIK